MMAKNNELENRFAATHTSVFYHFLFFVRVIVAVVVSVNVVNVVDVVVDVVVSQ